MAPRRSRWSRSSHSSWHSAKTLALRVYITFDTEIWLSAPDLSAFSADFARWFHGRTPSGDFGVPFQLRLLNDFGLKAVFFVEPLFASAVGIDPLAEMVGTIAEAGHDVQLHMHSEWLPHINDGPVGLARGEHLRHFNEDQQLALLKLGLENFKRAGAPRPNSFRAGNYGANNATLRALHRAGLRYDSSYNFCYLDDACQIETESPLLQPALVEGIVELPIAFFSDYPGHFRHAQIVAASFAELRTALEQAYQRGFSHFVIVSHSFELLDAQRRAPDPLVIDRFISLCRFLADHRDRFATATFAGASIDATPLVNTAPLRGSLPQTAGRMAVQGMRRALQRLPRLQHASTRWSLNRHGVE